MCVSAVCVCSCVFRAHFCVHVITLTITSSSCEERSSQGAHDITDRVIDLWIYTVHKCCNHVQATLFSRDGGPQWKASLSACAYGYTVSSFMMHIVSNWAGRQRLNLLFEFRLLHSSAGEIHFHGVDSDPLCTAPARYCAIRCANSTTACGDARATSP